MTDHELMEIQDILMASAGDGMIKKGKFSQIGAIVTQQSNVDNMRDIGIAIGIEHLNTREAFTIHQEQERIAIVLLDISTDWYKLFQAARILYPRMTSSLDHAVDKGKTTFKLSESEIYRILMTQFFKTGNIDDKDIVIGMMRLLCQKSDALAAIVISEAFQINEISVEEEFPKDFKGDPRSVEVITSFMDAINFRRMLTSRVHREPLSKSRFEGKVIKLDAIVESRDNKDGLSPLSGRFFDILAPTSKASA